MYIMVKFMMSCEKGKKFSAKVDLILPLIQSCINLHNSECVKKLQLNKFTQTFSLMTKGQNGFGNIVVAKTCTRNGY